MHQPLRFVAARAAQQVRPAVSRRLLATASVRAMSSSGGSSGGRQPSAHTWALHHVTDTSEALPATTPVYQSSAFQAASPFFYTRKNNPNSQELEEVVMAFEESAFALTLTNGMAAITCSMSLLPPGSHLVVNKLTYGCSVKLFQRLAKQRNFKLTVLDLTRPEGRAELPTDATCVFFETPTNPFLRTVPVAEVVERAKGNNPDALVIVDNTWATPMWQRPLQLGADVALYSATKYFSGHSDVMGGLITTDRQDLADAMREERFYTGAILDPHSAWLLRRSMQTFALRMEAHHKIATEMTEYLKGVPEVEEVFYPEVDGKQLQKYGGIVFFSLTPEAHARGGFATLAANVKYFGTGTGMACVTSMIAQPFNGSHASMEDGEKAEIGLDERLVRLCFGLESADDLKADLDAAFALLR